MAYDLSTQTILITGASSGIGHRFAVDLTARGAAVVLVARRRDRLEQLAADLRRDHGSTVEIMAADLTSPTAGLDLRAAVGERGMRITGLVNNAGFGTFGPFVDEEAERLEAEVALDVMAPVRLTSAFLPDLLAAERGLLINVASMAAYSPSPRMAVYGAAKAFVLSFTESLWAELRGTGITVFALSPGATSTEFNSVVGTEDATAGAAMRSAGDVVATALAHLDSRNPGPSVIDGRANRIAASTMRLLSRRRTVALMHRVTDPVRRHR
ncbi:SDR family oxidoreductase [Curtobacterium sp. MCLR17_036]|uniref:SDR family NAD(P)-dependent oxidoreductase n=1 Tax=Curtobacterium sp. MCLR17_036 TaxID=2175620 RepID=UPI000DAA7CE4|nr:SDR family oxidoreductase [Curtobacterium sp. MCLR17_036]WIE64895.1 SDR family oxidoreductase [Curtobacterium sp. MCLR17_036]